MRSKKRAEENKNDTEKRYEFIDEIKSDVMFKAYGKTLKQLFENSAIALSSIICHREKIKPKIEKEIRINAGNKTELMVLWLQEIIAAVDVDEVFLTEFNIKDISETGLYASCRGEEISADKGNMLVKAVTYHKLKIEKKNNIYIATISLDI